MVVLITLIACGGGSSTPPAESLDLALSDEAHRIEILDGTIVSVDEPADAPIRGDRITPGLVDAHAHPRGLGTKLRQLDLTGIDTYQQTVERIASVDGDGWIQGRGWDQNDWPDVPEGGWPLAADLDARLGERPVALRRVDGHAVWVTSVVLEAAGIDANTPSPEGGTIVKGPDGTPSGVLIDAAMDLITLPETDPDEVEADLRVGLDAIAAAGLTGVHAMAMGDETLAVYEQLDATGELPVRIWAYVSPGTDAATRLTTEGPWTGEGGHLKVVGIKAFADGALGSRGALLSEPYADAPDTHGNVITDEATLTELARATATTGAHLAVHAIGDAAVTATLNAFAAGREVSDDAIYRVEHAQVVRPEDWDRMAALDVVASMQPTHATSDMPWAPARLGPQRIEWAYQWRRALEHDLVLAFGSDFPVEDVRPSYGLWSAVTRMTQQGDPEGGWQPDQRLSLDEAVQAFTAGADRAVGEPPRALEAGKRADLTVWSTGTRHGHPWWTPSHTIVDGEVVWSRDLSSPPR